MTLEIFDFDQRSDDWYRARAGIPTASEFKTLLAKGRDGGDSKTRRTYMLKLAGERLTGEPMEKHTNVYMERGVEQEDEARELYAFLFDASLKRVGFCRNGNAGCSPDALVGDDGILEIKTAEPHILLDFIDRNEFPSAHKAQCQGNLWITGRRWVDILVYNPGLQPFIKRAERDEAYIADIAKAVAAFNRELDELVDKYHRYGASSSLRADLEQSLGAA